MKKPRIASCVNEVACPWQHCRQPVGARCLGTRGTPIYGTHYMRRANAIAKRRGKPLRYPEPSGLPHAAQ